RSNIPVIHGIDPDTVDPVNLGAQRFTVDHLSRPKVDCLPLSKGIQGRFPEDMPRDTGRFHTIWSLSDSLDVRRQVAHWAQGKTRFLVDVRASWPRFEWYIVDYTKPEAVEKYLRNAHRFTDAE